MPARTVSRGKTSRCQRLPVWSHAFTGTGPSQTACRRRSSSARSWSAPGRSSLDQASGSGSVGSIRSSYGTRPARGHVATRPPRSTHDVVAVGLAALCRRPRAVGREPDELRVRVREASARRLALVDDRVQVAGGLGLAPPSPRLRDEPDLFVVELGERAHVLGRVHDDLLPLERGVEVRDDADPPGIADRERLRRCAVLPAGAERARVELFLRRRLDVRPARAGPLRPAWRDHDLSTRERVLAELSAQVAWPWWLFSMNGLNRSIGAGKTIVVDADGPSSSSVCR